MKEGRAIRYYHYEAPAKLSKRLPPLVFMHGIGIGNIPYVQFLKRLMREFPNRSIVLVRDLTMRHHGCGQASAMLAHVALTCVAVV